MKILYGATNGLHALGYNSAESEPIWMKFGTMCAKCWRLALADFGRDLRSSDSLRRSRFFWPVNNARFYRFPVGKFFMALQHNNVDRWLFFRLSVECCYRIWEPSDFVTGRRICINVCKRTTFTSFVYTFIKLHDGRIPIAKRSYRDFRLHVEDRQAKSERYRDPRQVTYDGTNKLPAAAAERCFGPWPDGVPGDVKIVYSVRKRDSCQLSPWR